MFGYRSLEERIPYRHPLRYIRKIADLRRDVCLGRPTADGTLIEASASLKSYRPKDETPPNDDDAGIKFRTSAASA